jgi:hypothetical protein
MSNVDIHASGPLFDGRAQRAVQDFREEARDDIAQFGEEVALTLMGAAFKHPSGYYESQVKTTVVTPESARVDDGGVVYGPWLAGVGSRNYPVTRFKGYDHWRKAKQAVQDRGRQIAERTLSRHIGRMR